MIATQPFHPYLFYFIFLVDDGGVFALADVFHQAALVSEEGISKPEVLVLCSDDPVSVDNKGDNNYKQDKDNTANNRDNNRHNDILALLISLGDNRRAVALALLDKLDLSLTVLALTNNTFVVCFLNTVSASNVRNPRELEV